LSRILEDKLQLNRVLIQFREVFDCNRSLYATADRNETDHLKANKRLPHEQKFVIHESIV